MSVVTNIVLTFSITENDYEKNGDVVYYNMEKINQWLTDNEHLSFGKDLDEASGGEKHLEVPLFCAAFNYFNLDDFLDILRSLDWQRPEEVQVFIKQQEDDKFRIIEPMKGIISV